MSYYLKIYQTRHVIAVGRKRKLWILSIKYGVSFFPLSVKELMGLEVITEFRCHNLILLQEPTLLYINWLCCSHLKNSQDHQIRILTVTDLRKCEHRMQPAVRSKTVAYKSATFWEIIKTESKRHFTSTHGLLVGYYTV